MKKFLITICLVCLSSTVFSAPLNKPILGRQINWGHPLSQGLVGLWLLNEGTGNKVFDLSGNERIGTLANGASWISGKYGNALYFAGTDDNVRVPRTTSLEPSQLTIIVSIKPTGFVASTQEVVLAKTYNDDTSPPYQSYHISIGQDGTNFALFLGFTDSSYDRHNSNQGTISNNEQIVLAGTYDGQNVRLYKNGVLDRTVAQTKTIKYDTTSTGDLWFGVNGANTGADYTGNQDFIMIYNRALSAFEIAQLYREPFAMFQKEDIAVLSPTTLLTSLVSYWKLDEASGNAIDAHGSNDGTYQGDLPTPVAGKIGNAQDFDGTGDYVITDSLPALFDDFSNNAITWSFWMNTPEIPDQGTYTRMMDARKSGTNFVEFTGSDISAGGGVNIIQFRGRQSGNQDGVSVDVAIPTNTWVHVVGIKTAANDWQLYIDGVEQSGAMLGTATAITGTVINIGRRADGNASTYYTGLIDEIGIWSRALTPDEITELYNSGDGLAYPFEEVVTARGQVIMIYD